MKRTIIILAAILAIGVTGGAVAASKITGAQIKNGSVTGRDIKNGSLRRADIRKGTLTESRLSTGVRSKLNKTGQPGPQGPKGDRGPQGERGPQGAGTPFTYVPAFAGAFEATNASVKMTPDGAKFGPYADGGAAGGSVYYSGLNGKTLGDIATLFYTANYSTDNDTTVGVPYLRVFLAGDTHDVIFSPNTQPNPDTSEDEYHHWDVSSGTVRYDDDAGNGPDSPWATVKAAHADETISGIYVSTGFSAGTNLTARLRTLGVNAQVFRLGQF